MDDGDFVEAVEKFSDGTYGSYKFFSTLETCKSFKTYMEQKNK